MSLLCPITLEPPENPVFCVADGRIYEADAIMAWFTYHSTSPSTGAEVNTKTVIKSFPHIESFEHDKFKEPEYNGRNKYKVIIDKHTLELRSIFEKELQQYIDNNNTLQHQTLQLTKSNDIYQQEYNILKTRLQLLEMDNMKLENQNDILQNKFKLEQSEHKNTFQKNIELKELIIQKNTHIKRISEIWAKMQI